MKRGAWNIRVLVPSPKVKEQKSEKWKMLDFCLDEALHTRRQTIMRLAHHWDARLQIDRHLA